MFRPDRDSDVICALATPRGHGGIGIIRVSGKRANRVVRRVCPFVFERPVSHTIQYGFAVDLNSPQISADGEKAQLDEVLVSFFEEGKSFTGEETFEISCHGNPVILDEVLRCLVQSGARPAEAGEFTYRAFMNGRLDLVQAEGVLGLIEGNSKSAARLALRQLKGGLSQALEEIQDGTVWMLAQIEADIDFSNEGLEVVETGKLSQRLELSIETARRLIGSYQAGRRIREGVRVVLLGRPNVGKSSLLNALVGDERAIVTEIEGTTRDSIEGEISFGGLQVCFVDTAGIRDTSDRIERLGVEKTRKESRDADMVFYVVSTDSGLSAHDLGELKQVKCPTVVVVNKSDLSGDQGVGAANEAKSLVASLTGDSRGWLNGEIPVISTSAQNSREVGKLLELLSKFLDLGKGDSSAVVAQARHFELISKCLTSLEAAKAVWQSGAGNELVAIDLRMALRSINEVLGVDVDDQVIDRVFKEFCIGK